MLSGCELELHWGCMTDVEFISGRELTVGAGLDRAEADSHEAVGGVSMKFIVGW